VWIPPGAPERTRKSKLQAIHNFGPVLGPGLRDCVSNGYICAAGGDFEAVNFGQLHRLANTFFWHGSS